MRLLKPGDTLLGRYTIIRPLGGGGFGQTYLAQDLNLPGKPECVVKQLQPQSTDEFTLKTSQRLFDAEAEVLHALGRHDQIPLLLAHFQIDSEFYLVEEFIPGNSLEQELIPGECWEESKVIAFLQDVLTTLAFVHQQNVIHRDIKPANLIRRQKDGKICTIDFGAVKQISTQTAIASEPTGLTVGIGTPGYMPSEQSSGKPKFSSDVYAVGMVAIQALTGINPDSRRGTGFREDPQTGEIIWRDRARVSQELGDVIDKMVRYDFRARYPSATEALQALPQIASGTTPTVVSPAVPTVAVAPTARQEITPTALPDRRASNNANSIWLGGAIAGGLIGAAVIIGMAINRNPQPVADKPVAASPTTQAPTSADSSPAVQPEKTSKSADSASIPQPKKSASAPPTSTPKQVTPAPTATSNFTKPNKVSADASSPEQVIQDYYININSGKYQTAWRQQSPRLQSNKEINPKGYDDYLKFWGTVARVEVQEIRTRQVSANTAVVDVSLTYVKKNGQPDPYNWRYFLIWDAEEGSWLLDNRELR